MRGLWIGLAGAGLGVAIAISANSQAEEPVASVISVMQSGNADGRTVMLIPGLASSAAVWDETRAVLEADYDVRTVQVAGFAGAEPIDIDGNYTDAIVTALVADLNEKPGQEIVLVGHSLGGFVSMKTALAAPELIDELVIVDSLPFLAGLFSPGATPEQAATQGRYMAEQMRAMPRAAFDAQQAAGIGRMAKTEDYLPVIRDWGKASDQGTVAKAMGELIAADLRPDLTRLTQDTLVMMPWDSAMGVQEDQLRALYAGQYAGAPNARIETIEGSFHFIMVDQTEMFLAQLQAALADEALLRK